MARFRLAARAAADLDEIWFTIAPDNIDAADRVIDGIHAAAELLAAWPRMGRERNELAAELRSFEYPRAVRGRAAIGDRLDCGASGCDAEFE